MTNKEFLRKHGIQDLSTTYFAAKRSRIFDKDVTYTSESDWRMASLKKLIEENGTPDKVTYKDSSTPQEEIWEMARTEREYDYQKGKHIILQWGDKKEWI